MKSFRFVAKQGGYAVYFRNRYLGQIVPGRESSGRHCFSLGCDVHDPPRTYRGKVRAAEALLVIDDLLKEAAKRHWQPQTLVVSAWENRPQASPQE